MDAFLKPKQDTDATGVALRMKTSQFYQHVQKKLKPNGLVVFNLNLHAGSRNDVLTIRSAFSHIYIFRLPESNGFVIVASQAKDRQAISTLDARARELDRRFRTTFSFQEMLRQLRRWRDPPGEA